MASVLVVDDERKITVLLEGELADAGHTVTVANAGPSDALGVVVADNLPAGVTLVSTAGCSEVAP